MKKIMLFIKYLSFFVFLALTLGCTSSANKNVNDDAETTKTTVSIKGDMFYINGKPTYEGRQWNGHKIEGLLMNARLVQGIFDDENPETASRWKYPDTGEWDPERNTNEFVEAMDDWYAHGLLSFTINMQGGSPMGYGNKNWRNNSYDENGNLKEAYLNRLEKILDKADELGMAPILGLFYFGQDQYLNDEEAVVNAVDNIMNWLFDKGYNNVLIEVNNECNVRYDHEILQPYRVHELIERIRNKERNGHRFLVSTSYGGGTIPKPNVVGSADFILLHGNGVDDPHRIMHMVDTVRSMENYKTMPIVFNEDDHFNFDKELNNMVAAISKYASWGYFDFRMEGEGFESGFQSVPVDWSISSDRKRAFFNKLKEVTKGE